MAQAQLDEFYNLKKVDAISIPIQENYWLELTTNKLDGRVYGRYMKQTETECKMKGMPLECWKKMEKIQELVPLATSWLHGKLNQKGKNILLQNQIQIEVKNPEMFQKKKWEEENKEEIKEKELEADDEDYEWLMQKSPEKQVAEQNKQEKKKVVMKLSKKRNSDSKEEKEGWLNAAKKKKEASPTNKTSSVAPTVFEHLVSKIHLLKREIEHLDDDDDFEKPMQQKSSSLKKEKLEKPKKTVKLSSEQEAKITAVIEGVIEDSRKYAEEQQIQEETEAAVKALIALNNQEQ